jgi:chromosome segregation ATPase
MPRPIPPRAPALLACVLLASVLSGAAWAQQSNEDRLREALKRTTAELRAVQDGQASLQAQLADAIKQRDALTAALEQARSQPAAPAADPAVLAELKQARDNLAAARGELAATQGALAKWQAAYKDAATVAQGRDADARRLDATLKSTHGDLRTCEQANARLIKTARDLLQWYHSASFHTLVLESYEPFLGLKRVELDNIVQDYEDRVADAKLAPAKPTP